MAGMTDEPAKRTAHLRNDNGSPYKWPSLGIENHAPGEVLPIELNVTDAVPFGFIEVEPPKDDAAKPEKRKDTPAKAPADTEEDKAE